MEQRERFIRDHAGGLYTMTEVCVRHSISRKTGYKWLDRFDEGGRAALGDRSRAPLHGPHRMAADVADLICSARRQHPSWGTATAAALADAAASRCRVAGDQHRWRSVEAVGAVDAQNASTAPWKTPRTRFPQLPQGVIRQQSVTDAAG
jgi:transposase-like protein